MIEDNKVTDITFNQIKKKRKPFIKFIRFSYFTVLHLLAIGALFAIFTALAVHFKWTNEKGSTDLNSRYFSKMANKYNQGFKKDTASVAKNEYIVLRRIGILAKYNPNNAKSIMEAYSKSGDPEVALRMLDAVNLCMTKNKTYQSEIEGVEWNDSVKALSLFEWSNYKEWKEFCRVVKADKKAIDSVSRLTGVEARMIVMCLVGEQVRMFNSGREKFKKYVTPFNRLILPTNRGYGVTGILQNTALRIERNLFDKTSKFYAGDYFQNCINLKDSFPELVNDTIEAHKHLTIQRLIKRGDHFYSYLYTAFFLRQFQAHWEKEGYTLSNRPEILGTLYNLGYQKSKPKANPSVGGSNFIVGNKDYTFGGLCYEFYYSGELQNLFPLTGKGFIPVKELEARTNNKGSILKARIKEDEKLKLKKLDDIKKPIENTIAKPIVTPIVIPTTEPIITNPETNVQ